MSSKGFTLIEVLVSLVIFLLIAVGVGLGLHHAVANNVFDSQRQDVLNTTLTLLDSHPPDQLCPAANGTTTLSATTPPGLAFTIDVSCVVTNVPVPAIKPTTSVPLTQLTAVAHWTTFGVARSVTIMQ
ncbi:prepilin-type N-terminal cleavage/methylation domain-containing protein [Acidiferrobacter sp.]|jgi:prepilin-type N-terminal cleavage/methylation domain-containing protein|uniref:PulJ/GspJ family protein n=1 Tax=Acidiferrobacter sp. TaxID=1872107 RepID=UPI0026128496|nr:prepilin-type N-terminal cleavage/methylation domain-containing protein [Acidiferrobacter sp.]